MLFMLKGACMKHNFFPYTKNKIFIETGSYGGDGIVAALNAGFRDIHSIELSDFYFNLCKERYTQPNVHLYNGDSVDVLPIILNEIDEPCVFWLDAHWCDPNTAVGKFPVPLLEELDIISKHSIKTHIILIDDCRLIREPDSEWKKDFPYTLHTIENFIKGINSKYRITYIDGFTKDDILVAQI